MNTLEIVTTVVIVFWLVLVGALIFKAYRFRSRIRAQQRILDKMDALLKEQAELVFEETDDEERRTIIFKRLAAINLEFTALSEDFDKLLPNSEGLP